MARRHGFEKKHLSIICVNSNRGAQIFEEIKKQLDYKKLGYEDENDIEVYYLPHNNSGKLWEYNEELREWFEK